MRSLASLLVSLCLVAACAAQAQDSGDASAAEGDAWGDDDWAEEEKVSPWHGFVEVSGADRVHRDPAFGRSRTLGEARLRLEGDWQGEGYSIALGADAWYDELLDETDADIRELTVAVPLGDRGDLKLGRQVLTWGTGDLLFLNDRFPKDFSWFAGRDDEYLKAPANALRLSHYGDAFNVDLALIHGFDHDVYFTGERFSFYQRDSGAIGAPRPPISAQDPAGNTEYALRLFGSVGSAEWALYGYDGFYRQPSRVTTDGALTFAASRVLGASARGPLLGGIGNAEVAWLLSLDDRDGTDPSVPNDQFRLLLGFERELFSNFTLGAQYYLERIRDYRQLIENSPSPGIEPEQSRHLLTTRLTWRTRQDRLIWSMVAFYSPTDEDYFARPEAGYRATDRWQFTAGGNFFGGSDPHTPYAQLEYNSNLFLRARYSY